MVGCQIGKDFAVEGNSRRGKLADQLAVGGAVEAGAGVDTHNPKGAELAFFGTAVTVGKCQALLDLVFGEEGADWGWLGDWLD